MQRCFSDLVSQPLVTSFVMDSYLFGHVARLDPGVPAMMLCVKWWIPKGKGKASSLDIAPLTILDSGALQPRKWQLTGND